LPNPAREMAGILPAVREESRRGGLWSVVVPTYLLLLWVVASASSRARGGVVCAAGLIVLAAGIVALRRGRPRLLYTACFGMLMAATCAGGLELLLRLEPSVIGGQAASVACTGYHWYAGGIYRLDLHRGPVQKPDCRREMYWNGHWWHHRTNRDGYRGPALERAAAVFLGDSMVYGHGVEEQDTLPSRFQERTGIESANLGQQGACMLQCLATFRELGPRLRPRFVFVCTHPTDVEDALDVYGASELRGFVDEGRWPLVVREKYRPRPWWDLLDLWAVRLALPMRSSALPGAVWRSVRDRLRGEAPAPRATGYWKPSPEAVAGPYVAFGPSATAELRLGWAATRRALSEIKRLADQSGAKLVLFDIGYPQDLSQAVAATGRELGAEYIPAGTTALRLAFSGAEIYLADDGHWSPTGNAVVARELARATGPRE
jgi:hypothetical protein